MLVKILAAGFYAKQDLRTPVRIGVVAMIANSLLNVLLIWPLQHAGIALATSLAAVVNTGFLFYFLYQRRLYRPREGWKLFSIRLAVANILLGCFIWFSAGELSAWLNHSAMWRAVHLTFLLLSSVILYLLTLWVTGLRLQHLLIPQQQAI
jgi:putative peptidoglycan lipid II flippase